MRKKLVAGNWKLNASNNMAKSLTSAIVNHVKTLGDKVDVAICPPFPYLGLVKAQLADSTVMLGAQNSYQQESGAFTGEVSATMLLDVGCRWVILGHSERRQLFAETDQIINQKLIAANKAGLGVIFCLGEVLADRQAGSTNQVLETQLSGGLGNLDAATLAHVVIAYEPVWAIGTGVNATPEQAQDAHAFIRQWVSSKFGSSVSNAIRILYGGSVKPDNAKVLLSQTDVDGALVGGASLKSEQFLPIIDAGCV